MNIVLLFSLLFVFIALSVPIGVSLGLSTVITIALTSNISTSLVAQNAFAGLDSFPLLAIPFFILAGNLMSYGGISRRMLAFADSLIGFVAGGLGMVTTVACMFFSAISGSAPATTSAIGSFMIPAMKEKKYDSGFACAITATAGSIGIIIPPSIPFVIYAVATGTSISDLFIAGIIPGIMIGVSLMIINYFVAKKKGWKGSGAKPNVGNMVRTFRDAIWGLLMPIIILGGIYAGIFTPTEAAVVGVVYGLLVGVFIYKELTFHEFYNACVDTVLISGATTFMIGLSTSFANYLTMQQVAAKVGAFIFSFSDSLILIMVLINIFLLVVGCVIDNISATIILAPILLPIVMNFGMDPVHFGVVMTMNLAIGFVTPPFGTNLFVSSGVGQVPIEKIAKAALPLIGGMIIVLLLTTYIPGFTMFFLK